MDHSDARETSSTSAAVFFCRGPRRLQTSPPGSSVHGLITRSLAFTSHRVSADSPSASLSIVIIRLRPLRSWKRELRRIDRTVRTILVLYSRRTLGRILRKHASASLRLSLPNPTLTILEIAFSSKILRDVRSFNRALPNTPLDLGPDCHNVPGIRALDLERNTPLNPSEINSWNHPRRRSPGRPEEHHLRHPHSRRGPSHQTSYQHGPICILGEPSGRATLHPQRTLGKLDYTRSRSVRLFRAPVQGLV